MCYLEGNNVYICGQYDLWPIVIGLLVTLSYADNCFANAGNFLR